MMAAVAAAAMTLGELFGPVAGDLRGVEVSDLVLDSRRVTPGAAFVAMPGSTHHGLEFIEDALARGAAAVVYESADQQRRVDLRAVPRCVQSPRSRGTTPASAEAVVGRSGLRQVAYTLGSALRSTTLRPRPTMSRARSVTGASPVRQCRTSPGAPQSSTLSMPPYRSLRSCKYRVTV